MELSDRLVQRMSELGLKGVDIQKSVGISSGTISMWRSGTTLPKGNNLVKLANALGVTESWLTSGEGEPSTQVLKAGEKNTEQESYSEIKLLEVEGSCGAGSNIDCEPLNKAKLIKEDSWFKKYNVKPADTFAVYAKGDSMEMFIVDGDIVIFNKSQKTPTSGKIFLMQHPDGLKIKRLRVDISGNWFAESLNDKYPEEVIPKEMIDQIVIIGQFVYRQGG